MSDKTAAIRYEGGLRLVARTGTGHEIVAPTFLTQYQPTTVVVMNPIYLDEIAVMCRELGVDARLVAI